MDMKRALRNKKRDDRIDGLFAVERELRALLDRRLEPYGLTYSQYSLLRFINDPPVLESGAPAGPVHHGDIAHYFGFAPRTVTVAVNALVAKRLVQRTRSTVDGRTQELALSSKGQRVFAEATKAYDKTRTVFNALPRLHWTRLWDIIPNLLSEISNQGRMDTLKKSRE
ncbi:MULTISPECIES: MarR family transcriptional regulator [Pseudoxanthomonas]|uniref:DNA-binding MarR family transcriptional regulator n=1 Tax=Pseudoxanthomonas winnipegensis TaxID=2480810 RepID=A0AAW8GAY2_9GAMM|nr:MULTISPECIES: MarR family transcriptional regulator [Pseudoxanthomonas]MDQ1118901.1 DNA-binding MarR family transcriptional regulator [Pseudoxanthomonas winnipegensis]MDQ1132089.1 DNA-binding MarR family transcriptional regulator [Pseudoxanthomonas winnipegensis]MDR6137898.1 DNA-binding MarR family transcriptional regulator [Pseudoxanthomonas sp. SORGH_AS_0997]